MFCDALDRVARWDDIDVLADAFECLGGGQEFYFCDDLSGNLRLFRVIRIGDEGDVSTFGDLDGRLSYICRSWVFMVCRFIWGFVIDRWGFCTGMRVVILVRGRDMEGVLSGRCGSVLFRDLGCRLVISYGLCMTGKRLVSSGGW